ncbi:response regulator [Stenotrophomonas sp. NPDC077659]|uniref:response regulator n=1 Tax=Stenotrophomonas sp. NPDC077659 TaxID=3390694 RepID=UPI003D04B763
MISSAPQRILLVEDDTAIRELTEDVLSENGYDITAVGDAEAAVDTLASAGPFDLLISDVRLPGMNGCDLARKAVQDDPDLRVLLVTGYAGQRAGDPQLTPENIPVLRKPFTLRELLGSVHATL